MLHQLPADELGHMRNEIRLLRAREVELRKCFTQDCNDALFDGYDYDVEVRFQKRRVLAKDRLPREILNDPQYFDVKYTPVVRVIQRKQPRPPLEVPHAGMIPARENFDVVETWN